MAPGREFATGSDTTLDEEAPGMQSEMVGRQRNRGRADDRSCLPLGGCPLAWRMNTDLTGRRALVCGSTQGIGRASAIELATLGASVTLMARDADRLARVCAELPTPSGQTHGTVLADFGDSGAVASAAASLGDPHEILVNNTGGPAGGPILDAAPDAFRRAFEMHVVNNHLLAQALVPGMRDAGYGRIVNVLSTSVRAPIPGLGVSNTIRGAVASWAKTLAGELGPHGITVNNVLPGFTDTARLSSLFSAKAEKTGSTPEAVLAAAISGIPVGRLGDANEIGAAVAFLASPAGGYISGISLTVDGGRTPSL